MSGRVGGRGTRMKYVSLVNVLQGSVYLLNRYEGNC